MDFDTVLGVILVAASLLIVIFLVAWSNRCISRLCARGGKTLRSMKADNRRE